MRPYISILYSVCLTVLGTYVHDGNDLGSASESYQFIGAAYSIGVFSNLMLYFVTTNEFSLKNFILSSWVSAVVVSTLIFWLLINSPNYWWVLSFAIHSGAMYFLCKKLIEGFNSGSIEKQNLMYISMVLLFLPMTTGFSIGSVTGFLNPLSTIWYFPLIYLQ